MVSVVLVTWNSGKYLNKCLSHLRGQTFTAYELVVVDNGSSDNSLEIVAKYFPASKIIENDENVGFSVANNQGINASVGDYVFLLNTDCYLEPDYLDRLVKFLESNNKIVGVQGKLLLDSDHSKIDSLGINIKMSGVAKDIMQGQIDDNYTEPFKVDALCAAAALYRKSALDEIRQPDGYFDPDFFSYYEDVDLGLRLKKKAGSLMCLPTAIAYHVRGGAQKDKNKMDRLSLRNKYFSIIKNMPAVEIFLKIPIILGWEVIKFIKFLFTSPKVLFGYVDIIRDLKLFISKRNA